MIKFKSKNIIEVGDWDDLVEKTYGRKYSFQQQDGCKIRGTHEITVPLEYPMDFERDSIPEIVNGEERGVSFAAWLARRPKKPLDSKDEFDRGPSGLRLFWHRNFYPDVEMIANDLYTKGLIPAGDYIINIDW